MSTSKIAKNFNPKKAVNPEYGKIEQPKREEVDKLEQALTLLTTEVTLVGELVKQQNEAIELIFKKLQSFENRIFRLEESTKQTVKASCEQLESSLSKKLDSLKPAEKEEEPKKQKLWFK